MDRTIYAIGDVHGCAGLLRELIDRIEDRGDDSSPQLVFLGDLIDKGPQTAETVSLVMRMQQTAPPESVICLKGNHEADLLAALDDERALRKWLAMGGARVLQEYGAPTPDLLPKDVLAWIARLTTFHETQTHYFVHAGLDPYFPRTLQIDEARLTMRGAFLSKDHDFGRHVVHGHTPQMSGLPEIRPFRTNIDTGAFATGALTVAVLEPGVRQPVEFLQTGRLGATKSGARSMARRL